MSAQQYIRTEHYHAAIVSYTSPSVALPTHGPITASHPCGPACFAWSMLYHRHFFFFAPLNWKWGEIPWRTKAHRLFTFWYTSWQLCYIVRMYSYFKYFSCEFDKLGFASCVIRRPLVFTDALLFEYTWVLFINDTNHSPPRSPPPLEPPLLGR